MSESSALIQRLQRVAAGGARAQAAPQAPDAWCEAGLARGQLHELFAGQADDAGAAAGVAVALALAARALPLLWLRTEGTERQAGRVQASGLAELGADPASLLLGVVPDEAALLRAAADAARCAGLGTLLVEAWGRAPGIDLTATRRLMLAAEASGVTVLLLRVEARPVPSAAATRWQVEAMLSLALEADAPGLPAFTLTCLRRRGGPEGQRWCVEWNRDTRTFAPQTPAPALSGAGLPLVADRAAALDPPAFVRRTG